MTIQETLRHLEKGFIEWLTEFNAFLEVFFWFLTSTRPNRNLDNEISATKAAVTRAKELETSLQDVRDHADEVAEEVRRVRNGK